MGNNITVKKTIYAGLTAFCFPLFFCSYAYSQELPPEPNIQDLFDELEAPEEVAVPTEASEPPPLPAGEAAANPSAEPAFEEPVLDPLEDLPLDPDLQAEQDIVPPVTDEGEPFEMQAPIDITQPPVNEAVNLAAGNNPSPSDANEYRQLKSALFEFLGKPAPSVADVSPAIEPEDVLTQDAEMPSDNDGSLAAELPLSDDMMEDDSLLDDDILADITQDESIAAVDPALEADAQQNAPTQTDAQVEEAQQAQASPEVEIAPEVEMVENAAPKEEKKPIVVVDEAPKKKPLPAFDENDKAYMAEIDQASQELPDFAQLSEQEKRALDKPLEELARTQKEKEYEASLPPEEQTLERGGDLSAIAADDEGEARSETYDLQVKTDDKTDKFLSTDIQLEMAYRALLSGQLEAAIDIYKAVMEKHPENQTAMFGLASAYQKNYQYDQAKSLYQELLAASPDHKEALNNYLVLITHEAPEDALLQLQKLERVSPYFSPIPAQIGMVYYRMGEYIQAERYLRKAITMTPDNLSYIYNLAIVSDHLGKPEQAIPLYEKLLEENKKGKTIPGSATQITERLSYLHKKLY